MSRTVEAIAQRMNKYEIRLVTHRSKPIGYEVIDRATRSPLQTFNTASGEPDLSAALGRARAYIEQLTKDDEHAR